MQTSSAPARLQAHALVDRMTPLQISAFIDLFDSSELLEKPALRFAPFCDELPIDAEDASTARGLSRLRQGERLPRYAPSNAYPSEPDTRNAAQRNRAGSLAITAA